MEREIPVVFLMKMKKAGFYPDYKPIRYAAIPTINAKVILKDLMTIESRQL